MALVEGTNAGFVSVAPVSDPGSTNFNWERHNYCSKYSAPATGIVTEVGIWVSKNSASVRTIELGVYEDDGGEPGDLLGSDTVEVAVDTNFWAKVTGLNIPIENGTSYWIAFADNEISGVFEIDYRSSFKTSRREVVAQLFDDPWDTANDGTSTTTLSYYALYEEVGTNMTVQVDEAYKDVANAYVQVDDAWKEVASAVVNKDDAWKTIF